MVDDCGRLFVVGSRQCDLDAIAGREDDRFRRAKILQFMQRVRQRAFGDRHFLAQVEWRSLVAEACQQQLHWTRRLSSWACAIQVTAEQQRATMARMAALRPRHPALTRKKISAR